MPPSLSCPRLVARVFLYGGLSTLGVSAVCGGLTGCLDREVSALEPETSNTLVELVNNERIDKADLLFVIDNSASMGDKQRLLRKAVPELVRKLVNPACLRKTEGSMERLEVADHSALCPDGFVREFPPILDFHLGVISSSLGTAPGDACGEGQTNDHAQLMGTRRDLLQSYQGLGFLAWDPEQKKQPGGEVELDRLIEDFQSHVAATAESGCGYEATQEAWYRFLVDPAPPASIERVPCNSQEAETGSANCSARVGVDDVLLAQRRAFLRHDSLVAVVVVSDENDCSVSDTGIAWLSLGQNLVLERGTSACDADSSNPCCYSCSLDTPAACLEHEPDHRRDVACAPIPTDSAECANSMHDPCCYSCASSTPATCLEQNPDHVQASSCQPLLQTPNLRCWEQQRRLGVDLLNPVQRYIDGFTADEVADREGKLVPNPLYFNPEFPGQKRSRDRVFMAGIVGVPHQDISHRSDTCDKDSELCDVDTLTYLTAKQLAEQSRWQMVLPDPEAGAPPGDPLMVESVAPRVGVHPLTREALAPATRSTSPSAHSINGREHDTRGSDLQYACIFPLDAAIDCSDPANSLSCDCKQADVNSPLCQHPTTGQLGTTQHFAKAYPGSRHLEVLRGIGDQAIVASICPVETRDESSRQFGYNPAVDAIVARLAGALGGECLPRPLDILSDGSVPCVVVEATPGQHDCGDPGLETGSARPARSTPAPELITVAKRKLLESGNCSGESCDGFTYCALNPVTGDALSSCQNDLVTQVAGFCYIDAARGIGNPELVENCPDTEKRLLRIVGDDMPRNGAKTMIVCRGAALSG